MNARRWYRLAAVAGLASTAAFVSACSSPPAPTPEWDIVDAGLTASLRGLSMASEAEVWVSGTGGQYSVTQDGGETWSVGSVPGADALDFRDVEAFDDGSAYLMSAGSGPASRLYRTDDRGQTWTLQHENAEESGFFNGMAFWDSMHGAVVGDPVNGTLFLLMTDDGGATWNRLDHDGVPLFMEGEYGFAASGTNIATYGDSTLAVVSGGPVARVFMTQDRGATWTVTATPMASGNASSGIFSVSFGDGQVVLAGGDYQNPEANRGTLAASPDSGENWELVDGDAGVGFRSGVAWGGDLTTPLWIAVGTPGSSYSPDGGRQWITFDSMAYNAVAVHGAEGFAAGPEGRVARIRFR